MTKHWRIHFNLLSGQCGLRPLRRGQSLATHLLADAVCDHVENPRSSKPLVASLHGSPGIGKSYFHQVGRCRLTLSSPY